MFSIAAALATLVVGPIVFAILSRTVFRSAPRPAFPVGLADGIGDTVFLPVFNGLLAPLLFEETPGVIVHVIALVIAGVVTFAFAAYERNASRKNDWSRPEQGRLNAGGWYHVAFFAVQVYLFSVGLLSYASWLLWIVFAGYALAFVMEAACRIRMRVERS